MLEVLFFMKLKKGYKKVMETEETKDLEISIKAPNFATASRMFKSFVNMDNIESWDSVIINEYTEE